MDKLWKECVQCFGDFYISPKDQEFFNEKGLDYPKRCWACRRRNREEREEQKAKQVWGSEPSQNQQPTTRPSRAPVVPVPGSLPADLKTRRFGRKKP